MYNICDLLIIAFWTNGDQTILQTNTANPAFNSIRIDDARLRNVYLVAPIHLEFDFFQNR
jgi:hypothetical protein